MKLNLTKKQTAIIINENGETEIYLPNKEEFNIIEIKRIINELKKLTKTFEEMLE